MRSEDSCQTQLSMSSKAKNYGKRVPLTFCRMKNMEDWLMQKRMNEASKYAKLRELEEKEEISRQMREEYNYSTYKTWLKK